MTIKNLCDECRKLSSGDCGSHDAIDYTPTVADFRRLARERGEAALDDAADLIESLTSEIERLRGAAQAFLDLYRKDMQLSKDYFEYVEERIEAARELDQTLSNYQESMESELCQ